MLPGVPDVPARGGAASGTTATGAGAGATGTVATGAGVTATGAGAGPAPGATGAGAGSGAGSVEGAGSGAGSGAGVGSEGASPGAVASLGGMHPPSTLVHPGEQVAALAGVAARRPPKTSAPDATTVTSARAKVRVADDAAFGGSIVFMVFPPKECDGARSAYWLAGCSLGQSWQEKTPDSL